MVLVADGSDSDQVVRLCIDQVLNMSKVCVLIPIERQFLVHKNFCSHFVSSKDSEHSFVIWFFIQPLGPSHLYRLYVREVFRRGYILFFKCYSKCDPEPVNNNDEPHFEGSSFSTQK